MSGSDSEEEAPPPIPPRGKSLSPDSQSNAMMNAAGKELMNGSTSAGHFLGVGRGDITSQSPLRNKSGSTHASASEEDEEALPRPPGDERGAPLEPIREVTADETALLSELNELQSLISEHERRTTDTAPGNEPKQTGASPISQERTM